MIHILFELSITRIITVYFVQGALFVFFLYLAFKILSRDKKRLNIIFSLFYICEAIGIFVNFIYAPITVEEVVKVLNFLTNFFSFFAPIFLLIFNLILLKSEKVINEKIQLVIITSYGVALFMMLVLTFIPGVGVNMNAANNFTPHWELPFFIYVTSVFSAFSIIPTVYFSYKIYRQFQDEKLKKKWKLFILGCIALYGFIYSLFISNTLNNETFRLIFAVYGLILSISASLLIYNGVGRQIEQ
ncbi:MAG: hypothetical protein GF317_01520 [Candidatus Lokiarchaeota archaeon]|nr:hypothetical protein [Candidatus Lokiarchaeota archaeon]MBD3198623.1 hypothetical protein [Candidatus Lokiarchaeota archaeon]